MDLGKSLKSFACGIVMTMILVAVVPLVMDEFISPVIRDAVGDRDFLFMTSDFLCLLLVWGVLFGFMVLLGAGGILRRYGAFGILGLIAAYWIMGDVSQAVLPLSVLAAILVVSWIIRIKKRGKSEQKLPNAR